MGGHIVNETHTDIVPRQRLSGPTGAGAPRRARDGVF